MSDVRITQEAGMIAGPATPVSRAAFPTLSEAIRTWARIALLSFGGPAGQIAVMHASS
ncbi:hypothetical protein [Rubellimicrobium rubrum]|uniref:hypothetical protein n=1 Tax=Rubellimicrobium rubrum TaxID=2585369 RepID=UPI001FEBE45D|nr:hypothetical protein [Rubellimicrobium rubrum]